MGTPVKHAIDNGFLFLAVRFLRKQHKALITHLEGCRSAEDIESVHQSRVACRRIRSALRMFSPCFEAKTLKSWQKEFKRLTRALGPARDTDVQIAFVQTFIHNLPDDGSKRFRPGIGRLLLRLRQKRDAVQPDVIKAIHRIEKSGVLEQLGSAILGSLYRIRRHHVSIKTPFVYRSSHERIGQQLEALLSYEYSLTDPQAKRTHHQMRIAAKRLRYTMEICKPLYSEPFGDILKSMKKLQTLLGDIHDCDVWESHIDSFIEEEKERTRNYFGHTRSFSRLKKGLSYLQKDRLIERQRLFEQLNEKWQHLKDEQTWTRLTSITQRYMKDHLQAVISTAESTHAEQH